MPTRENTLSSTASGSPEAGHVWMDTESWTTRTILLISKDPYWNAIITYKDGSIEFADFDVEDVERWYWTKLLPELVRVK